MWYQILQDMVTVSYQVFRDIVVTTLAGVGAYAALCGLRTWKKQLAGKSNYELSRRLLRATYRVRDRIIAVRNPIISSGEAAAAIREQEMNLDSIDEKERSTEATAAVLVVRWNGVYEAVSDLEVEEQEAEVLWGTEARDQIKLLHECVRDLAAAISVHIDRKRRRFPSHPSDVEIDGIMYRQSEKDEFAKKVAKAVEGIERLARPHLKI